MRQKFYQSMLLTAVIASALGCNSCSKSEEDNDVIDYNSTPYLVTTNSMADCYFKPKKLNIIADNKRISGNWFANDKYGESIKLSELMDNDQEYAEHYYFLNDSLFEKYIELKRKDVTKKRFIDDGDMLSPYKEYAEYFGDNILEAYHGTEMFDFREGKCCVLPIVAVDVICDKDFDAEHPAGAKLNDIMAWHGYYNYYDYLHQVDEKGNLVNNGKNSHEYYVANSNFEDVPLVDIPKKPLLMAEHAFLLLFTSNPSKSDSYEFTVKITFGPDPLTGETVDVAPAKVVLNL